MLLLISDERSSALQPSSSVFSQDSATVQLNAMTEARVCDNGVTVSGQDGDSYDDRHNYVKDRVSSITIDLSYISYPFSSPITAH